MTVQVTDRSREVLDLHVVSGGVAVQQFAVRCRQTAFFVR